VENILEGSVRREGNRVLVNVQLIEARSDRHLWAERYDRTLADSIGLQGEVAAEIAAALRAKLAPEEKAGLAGKPTENPEAYTLYLNALGRERALNHANEDLIAAEQLYAQAIALDPKFAIAYARLSIVQTQLGYEATDDRKVRARAAADEALRLAPALGEAHTALGLCMYWIDKDYAAALKEFSVAAASSPNEPDILSYIAGIQRRQGLWRESLATFQRAQDLDPRNRQIIILAARNHLLVRDWPGATACYNRALEIAPDSVYAKVGLAYLEVFQNSNPAAGSKILQDIPAGIDPDGVVTGARWDLAMMARDYASAEKILTNFPLENFPSAGDAPKTYHQGRLALARGDIVAAQRYFAAATPTIEEWVHADPNDPNRHAQLGLLYACVRRKEDAIREGRRAVEMEPEMQNAFHGAARAANLALVYALVGEPDQAITLIERLLSTPGPVQWPDFPENITLADLRLRWEWDSLRSDPRFRNSRGAGRRRFISLTCETKPRSWRFASISISTDTSSAMSNRLGALAKHQTELAALQRRRRLLPAIRLAIRHKLDLENDWARDPCIVRSPVISPAFAPVGFPPALECDLRIFRHVEKLAAQVLSVLRCPCRYWRRRSSATDDCSG
jgi:tetratricopeptide (TPR) repeat protein